MQARDWIAVRVRTLPERHGGRRPLLVLALVVLAGFGLRVYFAKYEIDKPLPDSVGYTKIAASLYEDGHYGPPDLERRNTYSPGTPLFAAAIYYATGGVKPLLVRLIIAALGALTIVFTYLIGRRLAGPWAGAIGAVPVAIYPALLIYNGMLMTEPLGAFTLSAAVLSFLWASERRGPWPWALPGLMLGLTALIRPEYLVFGVAFAVLAVFRLRRTGAWAPGLAAAAVLLVAFLMPVVPWTIRNFIVLDRFVPISTGGGQALYIGQYLAGWEGGGESTTHTKILADLERRYPDLERETRTAFPGFPKQRQIILGQALEVIAKQRYPGLSSDSGLTKLGRKELTDNITDRPGKWVEVTLRKVWHMWKEGFNSGKHPAMSRPWWIAFHAVFVLIALGGLVLIAARRRWEAWALGIPIVGITAVGAIFLSSPRRVMILVPLLGALAGAAIVAAVAARRGDDGAPA
jgi:4-amino-4-deoxy-L-arabinose transferase-like glycosyltransferase